MPKYRNNKIDEEEKTQVKGTEKVFNKIIEEKILTYNKKMPINVQKAYRTPNSLD